MEPGRRRGDEYKHGQLPEPNTHEAISRGAEKAPEWIRGSIEAKLKKLVQVADLNLFVYLNFAAYEQPYERIRDETNVVAAAFASVWRLNGNALCCIHPNSELAAFEGWLVIPESLTSPELPAVQPD